MPTRALILAALLVFAPAGCMSSIYVGRYRDGISQNQQSLQQLALGMTGGEVTALLGEGEIVQYRKILLVDPWRSEGFALADGTPVRILYYLTQPPQKYYAPDEADLTPIVLENDTLVGWGWSYLRRNTDRYQVESPQLQE